MQACVAAWLDATIRIKTTLPRGLCSLAFKAGARYSFDASGGNRFGLGAAGIALQR
jgi:hypothetical protein